MADESRVKSSGVRLQSHISGTAKGQNLGCWIGSPWITQPFNFLTIPHSSPDKVCPATNWQVEGSPIEQSCTYLSSSLTFQPPLPSVTSLYQTMRISLISLTYFLVFLIHLDLVNLHFTQITPIAG